MRRHREPHAARPGHGVATSQGAQAGGTDPGRNRPAPGLLLRRSRGREETSDAGRRDRSGREEESVMSGTEDIRTVVREKYGEIAEGKRSGCCGDDCGCASGESDVLEA